MDHDSRLMAVRREEPGDAASPHDDATVLGEHSVGGSADTGGQERVDDVVERGCRLRRAEGVELLGDGRWEVITDESVHRPIAQRPPAGSTGDRDLELSHGSPCSLSARCRRRRPRRRR